LEYEAKLKAFFDSSGDCHVLLSPALQVVYFNNKARAFVYNAYQKDMQAGNNMLDFISPSYMQFFRKNCNNALEGITTQEERQINYDALGSIWWHLTFVPVWDADKNIIGLSFNAADITVAKEQEERLRLKN